MDLNNICSGGGDEAKAGTVKRKTASGAASSGGNRGDPVDATENKLRQLVAMNTAYKSLKQTRMLMGMVMDSTRQENRADCRK